MEAQLLVKLFTRAESNNFNFDIFVELQSMEFDHLAGKVENSHRLAHIQHENLATIALCRALQYQAHGLGNRHEIAGHFWVSHLYRTTRSNLFVESRDNAT